MIPGVRSRERCNGSSSPLDLLRSDGPLGKLAPPEEAGDAQPLVYPPIRKRSVRADRLGGVDRFAHDGHSVFGTRGIEGDVLRSARNTSPGPQGQAASLTSIFLASLRAGFGMVIFNTPFDMVA